MWRGWKKDDCAKQPFCVHVCPEEGELLIDMQNIGFTEAGTDVGLIGGGGGEET
jgi:hypothetical protein